MKLLSLDPGLDGTGWALFDADLFRDQGHSPQNAAQALLDSGTIRTLPGEPIHHRLLSLACGIDSIILAHDLRHYDAAVVEIPATSGTYQRRTATRRSLNDLYMATGAILSHLAASLPIITRPAPLAKKTTRHSELRMIFHLASRSLPAGPRGGLREDELDAIQQGVFALLDGSVWVRLRGLEDRLTHETD